MRYFLILLLLFTCTFADDTKDNKATIGVGPYIQSQPYKGADDLLLASPVFFYDNSIVYARWTRFGVYFLGEKTEDFSWGFSLTLQPRTNGYKPEDSPYLYGMSEKKSSWEGGIAFSASYENSYIEVMYLHDLLDRYNSYITKAEIGYSLKFENISFYPSFVVIYQDKDFLNYYYGVTQKESQISNHNLYTPDSDLKYALQSYINYPINENFSAFFNARIDLISKEAKDSPLTDKDHYYSGLASLIYTFNF
jgi:outer membrane protein